MTFCGDQTLARFDPQRLVTQFEVSAQRLRPAQRLLWFLKRLFRRCVWVVASRCPPQREAKPLDRERRSPFWAINVLAEETRFSQAVFVVADATAGFRVRQSMRAAKWSMILLGPPFCLARVRFFADISRTRCTTGRGVVESAEP